MENILEGKAWRFGDDVDTDAIIPARYLNTSDPLELAAHCMEDVDPEFPLKVSQGDIIVGGKNFGCGSSREHAPIAIKAAGVSGVIAGSFARIFYRNAFNMGLPIFESQKAAERIRTGDQIEVNPSKGSIRNKTRDEEYRAEPYPTFMMKLIEAGGLIPYLLKEGLYE
jgi:3-isopropylmalate dehydratase small subunit